MKTLQRKYFFFLCSFSITSDLNISLNWPQIQVLLTNKIWIRIQITGIQIYSQIMYNGGDSESYESFLLILHNAGAINKSHWESHVLCEAAGHFLCWVMSSRNTSLSLYSYHYNFCTYVQVAKGGRSLTLLRNTLPQISLEGREQIPPEHEQ